MSKYHVPGEHMFDVQANRRTLEATVPILID
jgi:hypothetical protein